MVKAEITTKKKGLIMISGNKMIMAAIQFAHNLLYVYICFMIPLSGFPSLGLILPSICMFPWTN